MMGSSVSSKSSKTFSSTSNANSCENTGRFSGAVGAASSAVVVDVVGSVAPAVVSPVTFGGEVDLLLEALREKAFLKRSKARPKLFRLAVEGGSWDDMAVQSLIAVQCQDGGIMAFAKKQDKTRQDKTGCSVAVVERIQGTGGQVTGRDKAIITVQRTGALGEGARMSLLLPCCVRAC
jgi:hypothetical protein